VLGLHAEHYDVAATGGLVSRGGFYFDQVQDFVKERHDASLVKPRFEPVIGACLIGLRELGLPRGDSLVANVEKSNRATQPK
jgi:hypothetical protein